MQSLANIPAHVGPPDEPGWWILRLPTRDPHLVLLSDADLTTMRAAWQDAYDCWPLDQVVTTPRIIDLLTKVADKPVLLWELSQCFHRLLVAGPWTPQDVSSFVHHTQVPYGAQDSQEPVWSRLGADGHAVAWAGKVAGSEDFWHLLPGATPKLGASLSGAKAEADKFLRLRGFHLIDIT